MTTIGLLNLLMKIEKDIPLPENDKLSDVFRMLGIGDSVLIPLKRRRSITAVAWNIGIRVKTRKEGDMVRVWRTA